MKEIKEKLRILRKRFLGDFLGGDILTGLVSTLFKISSKTIVFKPINYPKIDNYIIALLHAHQCCLYTIKDRNRVHVMISNSKDGDIIAGATEVMGLKVIRGSKSKHGVSAAMKMIEVLKNGEIGAITIDGPRGPRGTVHKGIISIAKSANVPIIPIAYYSPEWNFLKFNTWDEFRFPLGFCNTIVKFGDPIYIMEEELTKEDIEKYKNLLSMKINQLYDDIKLNYKEYIKLKD